MPLCTGLGENEVFIASGAVYVQVGYHSDVAVPLSLYEVCG